MNLDETETQRRQLSILKSIMEETGEYLKTPGSEVEKMTQKDKARCRKKFKKLWREFDKETFFRTRKLVPISNTCRVRSAGTDVTISRPGKEPFFVVQKKEAKQ